MEKDQNKKNRETKTEKIEGNMRESCSYQQQQQQQ